MKCNKMKQCNVCDGWFKMERGCALEKRCVSCRELGLTKNIEIRSSDPSRFVHEPTLSSLINPRKSSIMLSTPSDEVLEAYVEYEQPLYYNDDILDEELNEVINETISMLNEREIMIIEMRNGLNNQEDLTYEAIGIKLGITRERVRQIENAAMKKLKHPRICRQLKNYVEGAL